MLTEYSSLYQFQFTPLREGRLMLNMSITGRLYFNSRPSARGDRRCGKADMRQALFQFTPLREGRPSRAKRKLCPRNFNSRPSARGDPVLFARATSHAHFNSRPSARGDLSGHVAPLDLEFQFTPLREGRRTAALHAAIAALFQFTPLREGRRHPGHQSS